MLQRRALLEMFLAAPAIIRTPGLLMPIKPPVITLAHVLSGIGGRYPTIENCPTLTASVLEELEAVLQQFSISSQIPLRYLREH